MLPKFLNLILINNTGQTQTYKSGARASCRLTPWKINSSGALVYGTVQTDDFGFGAGETIANDATVELDGKFDNSSNRDFGLHGYLEVTTNNASSAGTFDLYLEFADADGSDFPSDQANFNVETDCIKLGSITLTAAQTKGLNFEI